jgi:hypothetical protein
MSTHTPAPWFIFYDAPDYGIGYRGIVDSEGYTICNPSPMGEANARLIYAAPELLNACRCALADLEGIVDELPGDHPAYLTIQELRAAITKATGESQ